MNISVDRKVFLRALRCTAVAGFLLAFGAPTWAAGTAVGTPIDNTATVDFTLAGTPLTISSNTTSITVAERLDVVVTLQSGQVLVSANDVNQALLFTVTNTGNGSEVIVLAMNNVIAGDDFDPVPSVPDIYFDTDASGDLSPADVAYNPGDAVVGTTGGDDTQVGEYLVADILINVVKAQVVTDPFGGTEPIPGATLTYTISIDVASAGVATASVLRDPIPLFSTFVPGSITLNGAAMTDAIDADAGELDTVVVPTVVVRLGDLTLADGVQVVVFEVTID